MTLISFADSEYIPEIPGPEQNLDFQYNNSMMCQNNIMDYQPYQRTRELLNSSGFVDIPRTPQRMPVMGTRTYQHRRTMSNVSHYSNVNRGFQVESEEEAGRSGDYNDLDYRFSSLNIEPYLVPFNKMSESQQEEKPISSNLYQSGASIPNRMRLYENISVYQQRQQSPSSGIQQNLSQPHQQISQIEHSNTPTHLLKTSPNNNSNGQQEYEQRPRFINQTTILASNSDYANSNNTSTNKIANSTGCTPTHSTPHDSFTSDDSSYLSAREGISMSSTSRVRFSPDNFLNTESHNSLENSAYNPQNHHFHHQRRLSRRHFEEQEKS